MPATSRPRLMWTVALTALYAVAFAVMYVLWAAFHPTYFSIATGVYVVLLGLALIFARPRRAVEDVSEERPDVTGDFAVPVRPGSGGSSELYESTTARPDFVTGLPEIVVASKATPVVDVAPAGFQFEGYTLYERTVKGKTQRFFAKGKPVGGGVAIPLPEGFEAVWDKKQKKPVLLAVQAEAEEKDDALTVGEAAPIVTVNTDRKCNAMPSPGIFCNNLARPGEATCAKHVNWSSASELTVRPDGREGKAVKGVKIRAPDFVAVVAKPAPRKGMKPLKFMPAELDVRLAKPKPGKAFRVKEAKLDVHLAKPSMKGKAFKVAEPNLDVRVAKPKAGKAVKFGLREPVVHAAESHMPKPMRVAATDPVVRTAKPSNAKPLRVRDANVAVRSAKPTAAKPLRVAEPELRFRDTKPKAAKPLRLGTDAFTVRDNKPKTAKPLRVAEPQLEVRAAKPKPAKPLKLGTDNFEVHVGKPELRAKPLKVVETTLVIKKKDPTDVKALKGLRVVDPDAIVVRKDTKTTGGAGNAPARKKGRGAAA